jgi:hypothetical protein
MADVLRGEAQTEAATARGAGAAQRAPAAVLTGLQHDATSADAGAQAPSDRHRLPAQRVVGAAVDMELRADGDALHRGRRARRGAGAGDANLAGAVHRGAQPELAATADEAAVDDLPTAGGDGVQLERDRLTGGGRSGRAENRQMAAVADVRGTEPDRLDARCGRGRGR